MAAQLSLKGRFGVPFTQALAASDQCINALSKRARAIYALYEGLKFQRSSSLSYRRLTY